MIPATVLFGDVVDSRRDPGAAGFLRSLRDELDASTAHERLAPAGFTQGDEIQLLLVPGADPFRIMLRSALHPDARGLRWAALGFVVGVVFMIATLSVSFVLAFVGFLVMLASALAFERSLRRLGRVGIQQITQRRTSSGVRAYFGGTGQRMRERFRNDDEPPPPPPA